MNNDSLTVPTQKWRFSAPQTHLWLIKVWFSASTFVVKIATFAKPENVNTFHYQNKAIKKPSKAIYLLGFKVWATGLNYRTF